MVTEKRDFTVYFLIFLRILQEKRLEKTMRKRIFEFFTLFLIGAMLYPAIEILFRGYTHLSMSLLGGICLVCIRLVDLSLGKLRRVWKAAVSAVIITQFEFLTGLILNCLLGLRIWDYSHLPLNIAGQICPLFTFFWFLLSFAVLLSFQKIPQFFREARRFSRLPRKIS